MTDSLETRLLNPEDPLFNSISFVQYDPFQIPPDLHQAENHSKARRVMKQIPGEIFTLCPCCNMPLEGRILPVGCELEDLSFLGCAYPFYFYFTKQIILILCVVAFLGGSFKLLLQNRYCEDKCITFLGFAIHNPEINQENFVGQSWMDTFISLLMIFYVVWSKSRSFHAMKQYNDAALSPRYYTVMIQNLPRSASSEEILSFFSNLTKSPVNKINLAYDIGEYKNDFNKKLSLCSNLKSLSLNLTEVENSKTLSTREKSTRITQLTLNIKNLINEKMKLEQKLQEFNEACELGSEKFAGTAFISFESQSSVKVILDNWGVTWFKTVKFLIFGDLFNPYLKFQGNTILIHSAPDPSDLIWENLNFSFWRDVFNNIVMFFCAFLILVLSFQIQFAVVKVVQEIKNDREKEIDINSLESKLSALALSSMILVTNFLLKLIVFFFSKSQKLYSFTKLNESFVNIYIWLVFFNSSLMPFLVHYRIYNRETPELLIWDIHFILLSNSFSMPFCKIIDPFLWYRYYMRSKIISEGKNCILTQHETNLWFEGHPFDVAENYAYIARSLLIGSWFASMAPLGLLFSMIGIAINYWLDKYFLLRINSFPVNQNEGVIYKFVNNLEIVPYLYIYGAIEYQRRVVISQNLIDFTWNFIYYGITSVSLTFCLVIYYLFYKYKIPSKNINELKYDDVKFLFLDDYDRSNPITQNKASRDYIQSIKQAQQLSPIQKRNLIRQVSVNTNTGFSQVLSFVGGRKSSLKKLPTINEELQERIFTLKKTSTL